MIMSIRGLRLAIAYACVQVARLLLQRDAEERVGRVRLVAVLGDPDPLVRRTAASPRRSAASMFPSVTAVGASPRFPGGGGVEGVSDAACRSTGGARRRRSPSRRRSSSRAGRRAVRRTGRASSGCCCPRGPVTPHATFVRRRSTVFAALDDRVADPARSRSRSGSTQLAVAVTNCGLRKTGLFGSFQATQLRHAAAACAPSAAAYVPL